ncbi:MAG: hypothetical protein P1V21_14775 [Rhizobiaceae bacterium]|nr:hypothetical protein [Rhizobiaceae bacterium]
MTVFVHSWFRSGSTWLWGKFRNDSQFVAYYEPLNEELPEWTPHLLETRAARAFEGDKHPSNDKHYFYEYLNLIASDRLQFDKKFAFDRYFLTADEDDTPLKDYLSRLIFEAKGLHRTPALCFCRSQMRASWIKRHFDGLHIAQVRNPWDQWASFGRHGYFKKSVLITAYCIEKRHPGYFSHIEGFDHLVSAWNSGKQAGISEKACFAAYSLLWIASTVQAVTTSDIIIDTDLVGASEIHRNKISGILADSGLPSDLSDCKKPEAQAGRAISENYRALFAEAARALRNNGTSTLLPPDRQSAANKLEDLTETSAAFIRMVL